MFELSESCLRRLTVAVGCSYETGVYWSTLKRLLGCTYGSLAVVSIMNISLFLVPVSSATAAPGASSIRRPVTTRSFETLWTVGAVGDFGS